MRHEPGGPSGRIRDGERNQLLPLPRPKTSRVEERLRKKKGGQKRGAGGPPTNQNLKRRGGEHPVMSSDT